MEIRRAAFIDIDGTVAYSNAEDRPFINDPSEVEIFDKAPEILDHLSDNGFLILGVTNQGGIAYGHMTVEEYEEIKQEIKNRLPQFDRIMYCPFHQYGNTAPFDKRSLMRKPNYGMIAAHEMYYLEQGIKIDLDRSIMIGDRDDDRKTAEYADISFQEASNFFSHRGEELRAKETNQ